MMAAELTSKKYGFLTEGLHKNSLEPEVDLLQVAAIDPGLTKFLWRPLAAWGATRQ